jgi:quinol monooxygenase YgiN
MPKFAIIGKIETAPGSVDKLLPLLMTHRERCLRDEPGTLTFEVLRPRDDDGTLLVYEVYRDEAAFDEHWKGSSVARARQEAGEMIVKITGTGCTLME